MCQEKEEEDSPAFKIESIHRYDDEDKLKKSKKSLLTTTRNNKNNTRVNGTTITSKQKEENQLYGYFKRQASKISHKL